MKQIALLKKLILIFNLSTNMAFADNHVLVDMVDDYISVVTTLDYTQKEEELYVILQERLKNESEDDVILRPLLALYRVEESAGNFERADLIREMLLKHHVNTEDQELGLGLIGKSQKKCLTECLGILIRLPMHSFDELGEAFGAMGMLDKSSSYSRTGLNSKALPELLNGPFKKRDLIAMEYARLLSEYDPLERSPEKHLSFINQQINRLGFIEGFIKPFFIQKEMMAERGEFQKYEEMNSLMGRFGIKNDFSIFAQRDLRENDEFGKGDYLSRKMQYSANHSGSSSTIGTMQKMGESYLIHRIENLTGQRPEELKKAAQNVKDPIDATMMMGRILFMTALDTGITAASPGKGNVGKAAKAIDLARDAHGIPGDERKTEKVEVEIEKKVEKKQEEKVEKKKEETKKEETKISDNQPKDNTPKEKAEKSDPLPTEDDHGKGEEYLTPDILTIPPHADENPDHYLTPEEKEAKRKAEEELKDSMVILTAPESTDDKPALGIDPKPIVNPLNSTPTKPVDVSDAKLPIDFQKILKDKRDIVINPGMPGKKLK